MELKSRQVLKIKTISKNNPYNVEEGHSLYGKTYNTYQYDGIVFTVNAEDEFVTWKDQGALFSVDLKEGKRFREIDGQEVEVDTLQLTSCTNINQETAMARAESLLAKIYRDAETTNVEEDILSSLAGVQ